MIFHIFISQHHYNYASCYARKILQSSGNKEIEARRESFDNEDADGNKKLLANNPGIDHKNVWQPTGSFPLNNESISLQHDYHHLRSFLASTFLVSVSCKDSTFNVLVGGGVGVGDTFP